jgi:hypothetical protein
MNRGVPISVLRRGILVAVAIIACGFFTPASARAKNVMLLLKQSPIKGGELSPVAGTYYFEPGSEVALTAVPKPGYRFLHWLGDVSDPTATKTTIHLNKPKIVVAVFEQNDPRLRTFEEPPIGGGGGGLFSNPADLSWPGGFNPGGGSTRPPTQPSINIPIGGNQPIPEPATGVLLLVGGLLALRRQGSKQIQISKS